MDAQPQRSDLFTVQVEGTIATLQDMGFVSSVIAFRTDGEIQDALVTATPEQIAKLHELLRVKFVGPAADGIYVGHTGEWNVVAQGALQTSGRWYIPRENSTANAPMSAPMSTPVRGGATERDPVCGMMLVPGHEEANVTYRGQTYHFCSTVCRDLFLQTPAQFAGEPARAN